MGSKRAHTASLTGHRFPLFTHVTVHAQKLYTQRMILVPVTQLPESLQRQWSLDPHGLAAKWMVSNPPICA